MTILSPKMIHATGTTTLSTFVGDVASLSFPGVVKMSKKSSNTWEVRAPNGSLVDISGTTTQGFQEAINYACDNGFSLSVVGGGCPSEADVPNDESTINCSTGIVFPAMQGRTISINWCTINFGSEVTGPGILFDTCMMVTVYCNAQIVYMGNEAAIVFQPVNIYPMDGQPGGPAEGAGGIVDSNFYFHTIAVAGGSNPAVIRFDAAYNAITHSKFCGIEWNGAGNAVHGIQLLTPGPGQAMYGDRFECEDLHQCTGVSLQVGSSTSASDRIYGNWFHSSIAPQGASSVG